MFRFILLDGQMPETDGFALAEIIRKDVSLTGTIIMMLTSAGLALASALSAWWLISGRKPQPVSSSKGSAT